MQLLQMAVLLGHYKIKEGVNYFMYWFHAIKILTLSWVCWGYLSKITHFGNMDLILFVTKAQQRDVFR